MNTKPLTKILVVDDDPDLLTIVKYALGLDKNLTVKCLPSAEEALKEVIVFQPDLILLDVMMPKMDGVTMLKILRSQSPTASIPVVFFTARVTEDELKAYKDLQVQGVIIKPFDPLSLAKQIQELWKNAEISLKIS
ncbi:MAG: response regulator [Verrucomicrobia bacterium]|nr:response regulator [Verrucomicrobiota bacterium]MBS0646745.1 response regulator [Verrucomicrobiota bacterium]